jgi:hypothetical protein
MKSNYLKNLGLFIVLLIMSSCEKEIYIDLNKTNPRYVIEGNINNVIGNSTIKITRTLNFDQTIKYPPVNGALVTITDTLLTKIDTLIEKNDGVYTKALFIGIEGHTYIMTVKIEDKVFTAVSTMPYSLRLDSLAQLNLAGSVFAGGPPAGTPAAGTTIQIMPLYLKSKSSDKYYEYVIVKNDTLLDRITARADLLSNLVSISFPLFVQAKKNDVFQFDMQFLDKPAYEYLMDLSRNIGQFSASPANPTTNISNGAFGYFKAHTSQKKIIVIK